MKKVAIMALLFLVALSAHAEWYECGTLHRGNGLEWQQASYENKLATAGDFIATFYQRGNLSPDLADGIRDMDDMHAVADALVAELDAAFEPDPDPDENRRMFANQEVSAVATMVMLLAGWIAP